MNKGDIVDKISKLRTRANLSARALSVRIGKNESYINRMESKKDFLPTIETLMDIVEECNSSLEEFFYRDIDDYKSDKKIIDLLEGINEKQKDAIVTILKGLKRV